MEERVELAGVSLRYHRGTPWVLRGVEAKVEPGQAVLLTGRNGAGKSTLLQVIAGLLPTSRGSVLNRPAVVGWVPERFPAQQPFTAGAYLTSIARVRGLTAAAARESIGRWSERLYFDSLDTRLGELSKGSAQKVNLAQALLVRPSLLVMDEPWEALDAQTRHELPAIIGEVTAAGGCAVFSDHRGEAGVLPGVRRWYLDEGLLTEPVTDETGRHVIEIVVSAKESAAAVAQLRAAGHEVRAVRREKLGGPPGRERRPGPAGGPGRAGGARPAEPATAAAPGEHPAAPPADRAGEPELEPSTSGGKREKAPEGPA
jgi:ABC-type Mn2+/Zn2+ transport system ATPase subunit